MISGKTKEKQNLGIDFFNDFSYATGLTGPKMLDEFTFLTHFDPSEAWEVGMKIAPVGIL